MCWRVTLSLSLVLCGCTSPDQSLILYRLPYANGTDVRVAQDHLTHSEPGPGRLDLFGVGGSPHYVVVAAQSGIVQLIEDDFSDTGADPTVPNNYVWISHAGGEWTGYFHLRKDSVDMAGLTEGDAVNVGQAIGIESDVGSASGFEHLHFEVRVPTNPDDPLKPDSVTGDIVGIYRIPRFCGVPGQILNKDDIHESSACVDPAPPP